MNKIFLIGNLTKDPEIKVTQSGKKLAKFSMAINDGKNSAGQEMVQYFNLTAWDKLADIIESYVKKGHKVAIIGSLQNRSWDKPDGTKGYATDITVRELEMLTSKNDAEKINAMNQANGDSSQQAPRQSTSPSAKPAPAADKDEQLPEIDVNDINVTMPF
jgi:single-strand DNA-binding protein